MLPLLLALACVPSEEAPGNAVDNDADGSPAGEDCHEGNPAIYPGAPERCDDLDNDCDGAIDEDPTDTIVGYPDDDGDGFGLAVGEVWACALPAGHVSVAGDCDDDDAGVSPSAVETCDDVDQDCDGEVDDGATDAATWYADDDGDGFGDADSATTTCDRPDGWIADGTDCDDADPGAFPGNVEVCDLYDQDCDGFVDEDDAADALTWYRDDDEDGYGTPYESRVSCSEGRGWALVAGDCDDDKDDWNPDAVERCDEEDEDCDGVVDDEAVDRLTFYADADGDGWGAAVVLACEIPAGATPVSGDCDDADAGSYPGATETCDGADDDCDGATDEPDAADALTWYADADGDGYGDATAPSPGCSAPVGTVADATDCDDASADVSPAGVESCDAVDQDCDGTADDDATDALTWYADADGDGYGDAAAPTWACEAPDATVADATDCDDANQAHHPGASETCDGGDDDCDGTTDESSAIDAPTWYFDADSDGYGASSAPTVSCNAPARHVATGGDCLDIDATAYPGAAEICDGVDDDCSGVADDHVTSGLSAWYDDDRDGYGDPSRATFACSLSSGLAGNDEDCDDADSAVSPAALDLCGDSVDGDCDGDTSSCATDLADADGVYDAEGYVARVSAGDVDGDGISELIVGAPTRTGGGGVVYVADSTATGALTASIRVTATSTTSRFGGALASGRDLDGDGLDDVVVGARYDPSAGALSGAVWVLADPTSSSTAAWTSLTGSSREEAGASLALLDQDGDGGSDLLVGAPRNTTGGAQAGAVYVLEGPPAVSGALSSAGSCITSSRSAAGFGCNVASAGDVDGDGLEDAWVAACEDDSALSNAGAVYLLLGPLTALSSSSDAEARVLGDGLSDALGTGLAAGADVNGDGTPDLLVGAPDADETGTSSGAAWLFTTLPSGDVSVGSADASFAGLAAYDYAGLALALPGDLDGDGYGEIAIGAYGSDTHGTLSGSTYVLTGPVAGARGLDEQSVTLVGETAWAQSGYDLAVVPDLDGDSVSELLIGAYRTAGTSGSAYLVSGASIAP